MNAKSSMRILSLVLTVLMIFGALGACAKKEQVMAVPNGGETTPASTGTATPGDSDKQTDTKTGEKTGDETDIGSKLNFAASYDEVNEALKELSSYGGLRGDAVSVATDTAGATINKGESEPTMAADGAMEEAGTASGSGAMDTEYSETNVQVKGVDEGDIVKTDGDYIYILRNGELSIVKAEGANSTIVSNITVFEEDTWKENSGSYSYADEIYVVGDRLVVIANESSWSRNENEYKSSETTVAMIYNITDRSAPSLIATLGQDGYNNTNRLIGDTLYLISDYNVYNRDEEDPETYIPRLYANDTYEFVPAGDICILPNIESAGYVVVSTIDVAGAKVKETQSMLGGSGTIYMNADNLYIASSSDELEESEPYTRDQYEVIDYNGISKTDIIRLSLTDGGVKIESTGTVHGRLLNQFAMDEYEGNLRVVTTADDYAYSVYTDAKYGWENYEWADRAPSNALYVLNENLEVIGSIEGLGEDERVYSVRFDGDIGYFVTFRQTDPLFAVDLSDSTAPKVLSALKIPGFSEYLHVYSEGRLFGLGMEADEETGRTECMKLSMFDVSDPANVTEYAKLTLDEDYWSEALYNHKAILISEEKNMIAFPVENRYDVYGYSDEEGFYLRASFDVGEYMYNARGLYIGEYIYVCSTEAVEVVEMESFENVASIVF